MAQGPSRNPDFFSPPGPWFVPGQSREFVELNVQQLDVPFISSATVVYAPTLELGLQSLPFIASTTVVHAPLFAGSGTYMYDATTTWECPAGVYLVEIEAWGGGGGGAGVNANDAYPGGGGGAYAQNGGVPVTPGNTYTVTVGAAGTAGGTNGGSGGDSSFVGDGSTSVLAKGGGGGTGFSAGAGGSASASTGITKFSGGAGGAGGITSISGGAGGGEAAGPEGDGDAGTDFPGGGNQNGSPGGSGNTSGGDGGRGGNFSTGSGLAAGTAPGGGGGGAGGNFGNGAAGAAGRIKLTMWPNVEVPFISSATVVYDVTLPILVPFIPSSTVVYDLTLGYSIAVPFISSATVVYALTVQGDFVDVPFITSQTVVYAISLYHEITGTGPGNGGEQWSLQLAPNGTTETATLAASIGSGSTSMTLTGDGGFPATGGFCVTIDNEVLWIAASGGGAYAIGRRGLSNRPAVAHAVGATVSWDDTYLMAVESTEAIAADFYNADQPVGGIEGDPTNGADFPMLLPMAFETHGLENGDYTAATLGAQLVAAGFRSVALQTDCAPYTGVDPLRDHDDMIAQAATDANTLRSGGLAVVGWTSDPSLASTADDLATIGAVGWVPEIEGSGDRDAVITAVGANVHDGRPVAAITNYGGITSPADDPGAANLRAAGVTALMPEVYASEGSPHDDIDAILAAGVSYGFDIDQMAPVLGTFAGEVPSDYDGWDADVYPNFAIWSTAQTSGAAYDELEALNTGSAPPDGSSPFIRYPGWIMSMDCSQAYQGGNRYSTHVKEILGVFPPGNGQSGNKLDSAQPVAEHSDEGLTDECPSGFCVPARIEDDISVGDVALLRYTNEDASILTLGPRACVLQSWYGFKRVSDTNVDVTYTDPDGHIVDGSVHEEWFEERYVTVTLDGDERVYTHGPPTPPNYSNKGWPLGCITIRQGQRRIPLGTSPDWHDFNYVYSGFCDDCVFVQVLINRNGVDYGGFFNTSVDLPGPQDIDGPNATWDIAINYYTSVSWGVILFNGPYIFHGPGINGPPSPPSVPIPSVPSGGSNPGGGVVPGEPGEVSEGGEWGDISPPGVTVSGPRARAYLV